MKTISLMLAACCIAFVAAQPPGQLGYEDTPMQPNGKWHIHDGKRPQPPIVTPTTLVTTPPPPGATVLLGAHDDLSKWEMQQGGGPVTWKISDGVLQTGKGTIQTKEQFTDFQLHVEFATPSKVEGHGQERGNSGVYLLGKFEIQVLDSFNNPTYPDGQASAMYGQFPPLVNASRPPGQWQSYDIVFTAPRFSGDHLDKPAIVTVLHNGILVHNADAFWGPTAHKQILPYEPGNARGPIALQDHNNPVRYRNIWIRSIADLGRDR